MTVELAVMGLATLTTRRGKALMPREMRGLVSGRRQRRESRGMNCGEISRQIACATWMRSGIYLGQSPTAYQRELGGHLGQRAAKIRTATGPSTVSIEPETVR
jgi:hypothetical protein